MPEIIKKLEVVALLGRVQSAVKHVNLAGHKLCSTSAADTGCTAFSLQGNIRNYNASGVSEGDGGASLVGEIQPARAVNKIGKTKVMLLITVFDCTYGRSDGGKENALTILTSSAILTASGFITRQTAG